MEKENIRRIDAVKERIILFAVGVLMGAVISIAGVLVYAYTIGSNNNVNVSQQMPSGTPPEMPDNGQDKRTSDSSGSASTTNSSADSNGSSKAVSSE